MTKLQILEHDQKPNGFRLRHRNFWLAAFFLATVTGLFYLPLWNNDFINWDDPMVITDNVFIRSFSCQSIHWMWTTKLAGYWIPLTWMSLALDYQIGRLDPRVFHFTNLLFHIANTILVFGLCHKFLSVVRYKLPQDQQQGKKQLDDRAAFLAALLFAIHPIHVESVAWATERKDVLFSFFFLSSLWLYLGYAGSENKSRARFWGCLGLFVLSFLSKPMAVTLPVVFLIFDYWPLRRFPRDWKRALVEKTPFILTALCFSIFNVILASKANAFSAMSETSMSLRLMNAFRSFVFYIGKMTVPFHLLPLYPIPRNIDAFYNTVNVLDMILVLAISIIAFIYRKNKPYLISAWLYYGVLLAPVLGVLQEGTRAAADRYCYLPCLALFLPISIWAETLAGTSKWVHWSLVTALTIGLGWMTVNQLGIWKNSITLWESVVAVYPDDSQIAHTNLADAFMKDGRLDDALQEYERSIVMPPPRVVSHDGKGMILLKKGLVDKAITEFKIAGAVDPQSIVPHQCLWLAYRQKGMRDEAMVEIKKAIQLDPDVAVSYSDLGISCGEKGFFDESEEAFKKALSFDPNNYQNILNLGRTYQVAGHLTDAFEWLKKGIAVNSGDTRCWLELGNTYFLMGQYENAVSALQTASNLAPGQPAIEGKLAEAKSKLSQSSFGSKP